MKITQFEQVIDYEDVDAFMKHFDLEFPEKDVQIDFLNEEWFEAKVLTSNDDFIKDTGATFSSSQHGFKALYRAWLNKYKDLCKEWVDSMVYNLHLINHTEKLSKPFENYAYKTVWCGDNRIREYSHKGAGSVYRYMTLIAKSEKHITELLAISNELPKPTDEIIIAYNNYLYAVNAVKEREGINDMITTSRLNNGDVQKRTMGLKKPIKRGKLWVDGQSWDQ